MLLSKHIVIVAGEESGDQHAATFVKQLKQMCPELQFSGIGGHHMQDAGVALVSDLARYGVTGLTEILLHAKVIRQAFKRIKTHLERTQPALLILVDYPGFNLRLAKYAKEVLNLRILYYISPQIWAWKANRIHTIRRYVDKMAVILPFEKEIYQQAGVPVAFVGHPLAAQMTLQTPVETLKAQLGIPNDKMILALLPGSRHNEIKRLLPLLRAVSVNLLQIYPNLHIVIPIARSLTQQDITALFDPTGLPITFVARQAVETVYCCDYVIVASGTASLECALLTKPMCIVYKTSLLTFVAACHYIRVKYLGLCNLLQNKMIVPELLQYDCTASELTRLMTDLIQQPQQSERMVTRLRNLKQSLSQQQADLTLPELIMEELGATSTIA